MGFLNDAVEMALVTTPLILLGSRANAHGNRKNRLIAATAFDDTNSVVVGGAGFQA